MEIVFILLLFNNFYLFLYSTLFITSYINIVVYSPS